MTGRPRPCAGTAGALLLCIAANAQVIDGVAECPGAFASAEPAAQAGDVQAQYCLGLAYRDGVGVEPHQLSALRWLQKAGGAGHAKAQLELGLLLLDLERADSAAKWLAQAAHAGNARAMNALGELYRHGHGVERDLSRALALFQDAAAQGNAAGELNLGMALLAAGDTSGLEHIGRAVAAGDNRARYAFGELMLQASGNAGLARSGTRLILEAARQGDTRAQLRAAHLYETALAARPDAGEQAERWYREASKAEDRRISDYAYAQLDRLSRAQRRLEPDPTRPSGRSPLEDLLPADSPFGMALRAYEQMNFLESGKSFDDAMADAMNVVREWDEAQLDESGAFYASGDRDSLEICLRKDSRTPRIRIAAMRDYWGKMLSHPGLEDVPYVTRGWAYFERGECKDAWHAKVTFYRIEYEAPDGSWRAYIGDPDKRLSRDTIEELAKQEKVGAAAPIDPLYACGSRAGNFREEFSLSEVETCRRDTGELAFHWVIVVENYDYTVTVR